MVLYIQHNYGGSQDKMGHHHFLTQKKEVKCNHDHQKSGEYMLDMLDHIDVFIRRKRWNVSAGLAQLFRTTPRNVEALRPTVEFVNGVAPDGDVEGEVVRFLGCVMVISEIPIAILLKKEASKC